MARNRKTEIVAGPFSRPAAGPRFDGPALSDPAVLADLPLTGEPGWQSNGGQHRGHPARSLPFTLEIPLPETGALVRVHLVGVLALYADAASEAFGTLGASFQIVSDRETVFRQDLVNGRHYGDARDPEPLHRLNGDGTSLDTIGMLELDGAPARVDVLTIDVPAETVGTAIRFKDLGSAASFVLFDVLLEWEAGPGCPFHSKSGGIALGEIASIVRVGDRLKFGKALDQVEASILSAPDLDEARGQALTFLAMVTAATLEMGGSRAMHRVQLDAARALDRADSPEAVIQTTRHFVSQVASSLFQEAQSPSSALVDRALAIVERHYAKDLTDAAVAAQLGLSTSHFRFLFREATGQPFHKYLVAMRLEKARQILVEQEIAVSAVAKAVGFTGLSHFSRAFNQRFSVSPTHIRRGSA